MRTEKPSVTVHIMNVSKQGGTQDCGQFAIAFMTSLAYGNNPTIDLEVFIDLLWETSNAMHSHFETKMDKQHYSENDKQVLPPLNL